MSIKKAYNSLPRGGFLVESPAGRIQFGIPPETIKDTMQSEEGVPQIFVLLEEMFDWHKGISLAEIEFPLYFNFFIRKKKTTIVCRQNQVFRLRAMLQESLFGPKELHLQQDFEGPGEVPAIEKEMNYFRNNLKFSDLLQVKMFEEGKVVLKDTGIKILSSGQYVVFTKKKILARIPSKIMYKPLYDIGARLPEPYTPPLFSITCLGPSHGFDPTQNTSGYIVWLNHHGIMIDPPVNSTEWLEDSNVNAKLIDGIILTHCHADHDAGTFQKILEEGKITVYSTKSIMESFMRKYGALSGLTSKELGKLFTFHEIKIGRTVNIHGAKFNMFYTLHSIPTFGFTMKFEDQTFTYSSDHNNDPELHKKMLEEGIISQARYEELSSFPWDSDIIYHESGVPPLHTPIAFLNSLPNDIQKKITVYHIAAKDFPEKTKLTLATFGMENSKTFPGTSPYYEETYIILNILKHLDFLQSMPIGKIQEFITIVKKDYFKRGQHIIHKGRVGEHFYIIASGSCSVQTEGIKQRKILGTYEYFGELALLKNLPRAADIVAETDVTLYSIERQDFLNFISGTEFERTLHRLAENQSPETWNLMNDSPFLNKCSTYQKTWIESIIQAKEFKVGDTVLREREPINCIGILAEGEMKVLQANKEIAVLKRGSLIGSMFKLVNNETAEYSFTCSTDCRFYCIDAKDVKQFASKNPGLLMKLRYDF
jgi:CRP-like cAMP-binding protein